MDLEEIVEPTFTVGPNNIIKISPNRENLGSFSSFYKIAGVYLQNTQSS